MKSAQVGSYEGKEAEICHISYARMKYARTHSLTRMMNVILRSNLRRSGTKSGANEPGGQYCRQVALRNQDPNNGAHRTSDGYSPNAGDELPGHYISNLCFSAYGAARFAPACASRR
jgi:hypothetical protein